MRNLFLIQFAHRHLDFRIPELESVAHALNIPFEPVSLYRPESPFLVIRFCIDHLESNNKDLEIQHQPAHFYSQFNLFTLAKRLASRCVLIKSINELIVSSTTSSRDLPLALQSDPYYDRFGARVKDLSHKFQYSPFGKRQMASHEQQIDLFNQFAFLPTGPVQLDEAKVEVKFQIFEDFSRPQQPVSWFCIFVGEGARAMIQKYDVKQRPYIGTTSMDAELSLIMANMGCIRPAGTLGNDPFVGTGSLLLAMSAMGAYTIGSEIDSRQLRGGATFDKSKRPFWDRSQQRLTSKAQVDWWSNVVHYGLQGRVLDSVIGDVANYPYSRNELFDCVVTDPPYGIRAGAKVTDAEKQLGMGGQVHFDDVIIRLLNYAARSLSLGGRLVFWFPVIPHENLPNPHHPSFTLLYCSTQDCGKWARRLLTMQKIGPYVHLDQPQQSSVNFRDKYYTALSTK